MEWAESIGTAIEYIEAHLGEALSVKSIAKRVNLSPFYFQKGFSLLCGLTLMEYVRNRRLTLAGQELAATDGKVLDTALKYGYDSPDSFTKAFTRFHGITPSEARRKGRTLKSFAPLKLKIVLEGGYMMDYRIVRKAGFTVMGVAKRFKYEGAKDEIPQFWADHFAGDGGKKVCGMFGVNIDEKMSGNEFEYWIADLYNPAGDIPEGCETVEIPPFTWAVFPSDGPMPESLQAVNRKIFSEWLPAAKDYKFAAGYCIEMYAAPDQYPNGTRDENYHSEIWIPIEQK
ncbi:AraC family transcriptional regulator [Gehongia tenuis]|uniref:AraC family transcriptional regulator n=1 Tax=Gehongia tenuis TaxID=2763655 RepID=A0A926HNZ3_9FIRM|nr:AraC family transcriptional regulator [Gehongia tenuis]MBC8530673.1 AraC family transcriptional regulator [Gehongia tenuis]